MAESRSHSQLRGHVYRCEVKFRGATVRGPVNKNEVLFTGARSRSQVRGPAHRCSSPLTDAHPRSQMHSPFTGVHPRSQVCTTFTGAQPLDQIAKPTFVPATLTLLSEHGEGPMDTVSSTNPRPQVRSPSPHSQMHTHFTSCSVVKPIHTCPSSSHVYTQFTPFTCTQVDTR